MLVGGETRREVGVRRGWRRELYHAYYNDFITTATRFHHRHPLHRRRRRDALVSSSPSSRSRERSECDL
jgi:hypothetical protein